MESDRITRDHLATCAECRAWMESCDRVLFNLRILPRMNAPLDFNHHLFQRIEKRRMRVLPPLGLRWAWVSGITAVVATAAVMLLLLSPQPNGFGVEPMVMADPMAASGVGIERSAEGREVPTIIFYQKHVPDRSSSSQLVSDRQMRNTRTLWFGERSTSGQANSGSPSFVNYVHSSASSRAAEIERVRF